MSCLAMVRSVIGNVVEEGIKETSTQQRREKGLDAIPGFGILHDILALGAHHWTRQTVKASLRRGRGSEFDCHENVPAMTSGP